MNIVRLSNCALLTTPHWGVATHMLQLCGARGATDAVESYHRGYGNKGVQAAGAASKIPRNAPGLHPISEYLL